MWSSEMKRTLRKQSKKALRISEWRLPKYPSGAALIWRVSFLTGTCGIFWRQPANNRTIDLFNIIYDHAEVKIKKSWRNPFVINRSPGPNHTIAGGSLRRPEHRYEPGDPVPSENLHPVIVRSHIIFWVGWVFALSLAFQVQYFKCGIVAKNQIEVELQEI